MMVLRRFRCSAKPCDRMAHLATSRDASAKVGAQQTTNAEPPKAAIMVIGDEILSGAITDANTPWLAQLLTAQGVDVVRAEYIPDNIAIIQATVKKMNAIVGPTGFLFSSGGIGPTHDDVTYEAIAGALGRTCEVHGPTHERMLSHYGARGMEVNSARLRMATLPAPANVYFTDGIWVPLVDVDSVFILPGIPRLFKQMIESHKGLFRGPLSKSATVFTVLGEGEIADSVRALAKEHPRVRIGSYPDTAFDTKDAAAYRVKLQLDSRDDEALAAAQAALEEALASLVAQAAALESPAVPAMKS